MQQVSERRAIFILEGCWELDKLDINRSTVYPFADGIAKMAHDIEVYHSRFYDTSSFRKALAALTKARFKNVVLWIAAHGDGTTLGETKILDVLRETNILSRDANITGLVLGGCRTAGRDGQANISTICTAMEDSSIIWAQAYSCDSYWFQSTLIDASMIKHMLDIDLDECWDRDQLSARLAEGLAPFAPHAQLGHYQYRAGTRTQHIKAKDGLVFVTQPKGQGQRAKNVTDQVVDCWLELASPEHQ